MPRPSVARIVLASWAALVSTGCTVAGPPAIANGRAAYNQVINRTEDEQLLDMIIRERYDETFGMLAVSSVTANITLRSNLGAQFGFGSDSDYAGNLTPLSVGFVYEENPTISYAPLNGEVILQRALAPVSLEHCFLVARATEDLASAFDFLLHRINGVLNPMPGQKASSEDFDALTAAFRELHDASAVDLVRSETGLEFFVNIHDYEGHEDAVGVFVDKLGLEEQPDDGSMLLIPSLLAVGQDDKQLNFQTRSVLDLIRIIGEAIEVPQEHLDEHLLEPAEPIPDEDAFIRIHSSDEYPKHATVATFFRGYWFYVDATDTRSKRGFVILRTLIGMRLFDPESLSHRPTLTIPVSR